MYYEHPEEDLAYTMKEQYYFGGDILAATVCQPADTLTGLSERTVWFPKGECWYSMSSGEMHSGSLDTLNFTIGENPWFVRAGAVIPMADERLRSLQESSGVLRLLIAPGDGKSCLDYYEDDGVSQAYPEQFARTLITKMSDAHGIRVVVNKRRGSYAGISRSRTLQMIFEGVLPPEVVRVNGRDVPYARHPHSGDLCWTYDGTALAWVLYLPEMSAASKVTVEARYNDASASSRDIVFGKKGLIRRIMAFTPEVKKVFCQYDDPFQAQPKAFLKVSQCGSFITEDPSHAREYLRDIDVPAMLDAIGSNPALPDSFKQKLAALVAAMSR
jgi:hypothetical protein